MAKRLVVLSSGELLLSFLIADQAVYRICAEEKGKKRLADSLFKGKVKRLAKGMDGVFMDVGIGKDAFLPLKGESFRVGESAVVQMVRLPEGEKGAKLTTNVKLIGKYMVYLPRGKELKCSSKVQLSDRDRLCSVLEGELKEEGVILRRYSLSTDPELIKEELQKFRNLWQQVQKKAKLLKKPQIILEEPPAYIKLIKDYWKEIEEIVSDNTSVWNEIASFLEEFEPEMLPRNIYIRDPSPYINRYRLYESLKVALSKVVWLKGGGFITIEETEAFTVIDVNSGDPVGSSHEENAVRTNLEAVKEIVRQIILRDLGGIILIDFIDMKNQENKNLIIKSMQSAFGDETCGLTIHGFTKLGILEISRKRSGRSLSKVMSEECPLCSGVGHTKSSSLLFLELEKELLGNGYRGVDVHVHPLRYETIKKALLSKGYTNVNTVVNPDVNFNGYNISHG